MSRGAWVFLIGLLLLIVGVALFAVFAYGLVSTIEFQEVPLAPGEYLNDTKAMNVGQFYSYFVFIVNYETGDELTVTLRYPTGNNTTPVVIESAQFGNSVPVETDGIHTLIIQNTGETSVTVSYFAGELDLSSGIWLLLGVGLGIIGFVVLIVGLILWVVGRSRARTAQSP